MQSRCARLFPRNVPPDAPATRGKLIDDLRPVKRESPHRTPPTANRSPEFRTWPPPDRVDRENKFLLLSWPSALSHSKWLKGSNPGANEAGWNCPPDSR